MNQTSVDSHTLHLDEALTAAEEQLLPLLLEKEASEVADLFVQHIATHLELELEFIREGRSDQEAAHTLSVLELRRDLRERKRPRR